MPKVVPYENNQEGTPDVMFFCPGCKCGHGVYCYPRKNDLNGATWKFNGDFNKPTFTPSFLINFGGRENIQVCHSTITNGFITFINDGTTHELKGQTVELPEIN